MGIISGVPQIEVQPNSLVHFWNPCDIRIPNLSLKNSNLVPPFSSCISRCVTIENFFSNQTLIAGKDGSVMRKMYWIECTGPDCNGNLKLQRSNWNSTDIEILIGE